VFLLALERQADGKILVNVPNFEEFENRVFGVCVCQIWGE